MTTKSKRPRFQSGQEIFEQYIPNYKRPHRLSEMEPSRRRSQAEALARVLLESFSSRLSSSKATRRGKRK